MGWRGVDSGPDDSFGVRRLRHGIVVGHYQGHGIFGHADLTVLALWGDDDLWDGCGVF